MTHILSFILFLPIAALIILLTLPKKWVLVFKIITAVFSFAQLLLVLYAVCLLPDNASYAYTEKFSWLNFNVGSFGKINIEYFVAMDGLSGSMALLSSIVMFIASLSSFEIKRNVKAYFILFNILSMAIMGVFLSLDFFLFYVFYELMLLPLYFLIGIWGGSNREYASIKFFLYTLFGSVFMLLVMVAMYFSVHTPDSTNHTFNMLHMMNPENYISDSMLSPQNSTSLLGIPIRFIAFIVLFIGFAIKIPIVPFHTWLPDAHVEAPTPISIVLAGILLKVGGYAIIRICYGIFPDAAIEYSYWLGLLGMISIIYGALNALNAEDFKRMIAYSSISHMGFVLIGIASFNAEGMNGAVFQMFSHGILSSMLFFIVGILYTRVHDRNMGSFRGLAQQMPLYTVFVSIAFFASLGLPGLSGFIGEAFTLFGAFISSSNTHMLPKWIAVVSVFGILLGAAYFLQALQKMFFGEKRFKLASWDHKLKDLNLLEIIVLSSLALSTLALGIYPNLLFKLSDNAMNYVIEHGLKNGYTMLYYINQ